MSAYHYLALLLPSVVFCFRCYGADSIPVASVTGVRMITVERLKQKDEEYVEFRFPAESDRQRVLASSHYATLDESVIGIESISGLLLINPSIFGRDQHSLPLRENSYAMDWESIFNWEKVSGLDSRPKPSLRLSDVSALNDVIEISVQLRSGETGRVTIGRDFLIQKATLSETNIPIFDQPRRLFGETESQPPLNVTVIGTGEKPVQIWHRYYEDDRIVTVAKTVVNGRELSWIGPKPEKWAILDGTLYGIDVYDNSNLLIRPSIASEEIQFVVPAMPLELKQVKELEERFGGHLIRVGNVLGSSTEVTEAIGIKEVDADSGTLSIWISGPEGSRRRLLFTPSTENGILEINGSKTKVDDRFIEQFRVPSR